MFRIFIFIFFYLISFSLTAQVTVKGKVIDNDTEEGIPFANVYLLRDPQTGTSTDVDGYFELKFKSVLATDSLEFSSLGYELLRKHINGKSEQIMNVRVKSSGQNINEIVVLAGENPAHALIKKIVKYKEKNGLIAENQYEFEKYQKTELDIDNINEKFRKNKLMKPFDFVFQNIDSTSDVVPFLPAYIMEQISDVTFSKQEDNAEKEVLKARRVSGIENESVVEFIGSMQQKYNIYDNFYNILGKSFVGPFNNTPLLYYDYFIQDSTFIKGRWSYKVSFRPRRVQENTFNGEFWVDMKSYAIEIINLRMSSEVNINFVERMLLYFEADLQPDSVWRPSKDKLIIDFLDNKKAPGIIGRKTTTYRNYKLEKAETNQRHKLADPFIIPPSTLIKNDSFWTNARHEKLSKNEAAVYKMVDSIKNVPLFKSAVDVIQTVISGYKTFGPIKIGPYGQIYTVNPIEGHRIKIGVGTSVKFSKKYMLYGYLAYGFRDKQFKYGAEVKYNLTELPWSYLEASYKDDVEFRNDNTEAIGEENLFANLYRRKIPWKLLRVREAKIAYEKDWRAGWNTRLTILNRRLTPYKYGFGYNSTDSFNVFHFDFIDNNQQLLSDITSTEVIFRVKYAPNARYIKGPFQRTYIGSRFPVIEFQLTEGISGLLGANYTYHKPQISLSHRFNVPHLGWTRYLVRAGKVFSSEPLPALLLHVNTGNETYFYSKNAFNTMNRYEFVSDQYVELFLEHHFDGFFLNKIPLLRKLKWREVIGFKSAYGSLDAANTAANKNNFYNRTSNQQNINEGPFYGTFDTNKPFMEASLGIENIFKIIRVDACYRLNYLENRFASPFNFRATLQFNF